MTFGSLFSGIGGLEAWWMMDWTWTMQAKVQSLILNLYPITEPLKSRLERLEAYLIQRFNP